MKNKSVWVIECGQYSDYRVVGVFSSEEYAIKICELLNAGREYAKATVAEWPLDPAVEDLNAGRHLYEVTMLRDGSVERVERETLDIDNLDGNAKIWMRSASPYYRGKGVEDCLVKTVFAEDDVHAIKIVNERRTQLIALNEWPVPDEE